VTRSKGQEGMAIKRFEDIKAWQLARKLVREVYALTVEEKRKVAPGLKDQMRRAAVSAMANIAEGFERNSKKEFIQFLYIAKGSVGEVRSHMYSALDLEFFSKEDFDKIFLLSEEISKIIYGLIKSLKNN